MKRIVFFSTTALCGLALGMAAPATAQAQAETKPAAAASSDADQASIVVVGSRLRRSNFNSAAPITVVSTNERLDAGLTTAGSVRLHRRWRPGHQHAGSARPWLHPHADAAQWPPPLTWRRAERRRRG
jgi:hypothetical protein